MARILVVDDEEGIREFVAEALELSGHEAQTADSGDAAARVLARRSFDLLFTDLKMPGTLDGIGLLRKVKAEQPHLEVVVLTAHGSVDTAVEAMKLGAFDYLQKPVGSLTELRLLARRALEHRALVASRERQALDAPPTTPLSHGAPAMEKVVDALRKVARTNATVLLTGESGTGKEVAARQVHAWSGRADGPFVAINCAALSENLLESELFGHEKGAFTGASSTRRGRVELADGGTFFLDEVGELKPALQVKFLRVLQERQFERVGGNRTICCAINDTGQASSSVPYIDTRFFGFAYGDESAGDRVMDVQYASATEYVGTTMNGNKTMFGVNFADGRIKGYPSGRTPNGEKLFAVKYVRGNPRYGKNTFRKNSDGTVSDAATGLQWQQKESGKALTWQQALAHCEGLKLAGKTDWRLPNAKELHSIVDYTRAPKVTGTAAIDPVFSVTEVASYYWTGTTHLEGPADILGNQAVYIAFGRALGYMQIPPGSGTPTLMDVHGAGAQRSDPKAGDPSRFPYGRGPQGDVIRIYNYVRCVRSL